MNNIIEVLVTVPFNEALIDSLRAVSPRLHVSAFPARKVEDVPPELWERAEVLYTDSLIPQPEQAPNLKWIQFHFAGIDYAADQPLLQKPEMIATNLSGAASTQAAEYVVMMLLALGHRLPDLMAIQAKAEWPKDRTERVLPRPLRGSTGGIVGYGSIGRQTARLRQPFNVTILATKRDVMRPHDTGYTQDGLGDPQGDFFQRLYPIQALRSMFRECDFVVVTLPLTHETRGLIKLADLEALKPGAFLVDVSRGGIIDPAALVSALQDKKIAGAALDVFAEEPLPASSPLWKLPNVIITPHLSGTSPYYNERAAALFAENLNRYLVGLPLYNRFDPQKGY
jgi:phosphoglycerate dehydrogenase-like enzyme